MLRFRATGSGIRVGSRAVRTREERRENSGVGREGLRGNAVIAGEGVGEIEEGVRRESMRDVVSGGCGKVCDGVGGEFCGRKGIGRSRIGGEEGEDQTDGQIVKRKWGIGSGQRRTVEKGELHATG